MKKKSNSIWDEVTSGLPAGSRILLAVYSDEKMNSIHSGINLSFGNARAKADVMYRMSLRRKEIESELFRENDNKI